jgi:hypothetical protein
MKVFQYSVPRRIFIPERGSYWGNGENYIMKRYIIGTTSNKLDGWNL